MGSQLHLVWCCLCCLEQSCTSHFHLPYNTHRFLLPYVVDGNPIRDQLLKRCVTFYESCDESKNSIIQLLVFNANFENTPMGINMRYIAMHSKCKVKVDSEKDGAVHLLHPLLKDRAHLSTFQIFIFEKCSCFIVLVVFLVIVQSSELVSVWFCEKMTFFPIFFSYHIFAIYVGGASLGLPTACRLIAVNGARLPSVDGLVVRCIKMYHHVKSAITICLQFI